jgi:hypothetical protein
MGRPTRPTLPSPGFGGATVRRRAGSRLLPRLKRMPPRRSSSPPLEPPCLALVPERPELPRRSAPWTNWGPCLARPSGRRISKAPLTREWPSERRRVPRAGTLWLVATHRGPDRMDALCSPRSGLSRWEPRDCVRWRSRSPGPPWPRIRATSGRRSSAVRNRPPVTLSAPAPVRARRSRLLARDPSSLAGPTRDRISDDQRRRRATRNAHPRCRPGCAASSLARTPEAPFRGHSTPRIGS